jgi:hypothetical protein
MRKKGKWTFIYMYASCLLKAWNLEEWKRSHAIVENVSFLD